MAADETKVRGIAPPLYAVVNLSTGIAQGLVVVTLTWVLRHNGVSVAAIAVVGAMWVLPAACRFILGPILDSTLTPIKWCLIGLAGTAGGILALGLAPLDNAGLPILIALVMTMSVAANATGLGLGAAMAMTTPLARRGAVAGWANAGALGGTGLGGGLGLELTRHAGGFAVAVLILAPLTLAAGLPLLRFRLLARGKGISPRDQARDLAGAVLRLARSRNGALALIAVTLPACLGAAAGLFPAVAGDWRASADLVAGTTGVLGGLVTVPGCLVGGYLCDRFPRRATYIASALVFAIGEVAMALGPRTPEAFAVFVLLTAFLLGVGFAAVNAVILESLGPKAPATINSLMGSLANVPVVIGGILVGAVQTRHGSTAMLLSEAAVAVVALGLYTALAIVWRPAPLTVPVAATG